MWTYVTGTVVPGHGVASEQTRNPRFPGGTLRMQAPHFLERGLDLSAFHLATLNLSIAPFEYTVRTPKHTFRNVSWHPTEPAEDFSFFDCQVISGDGSPRPGLIYYPHPETKPAHVQPPDVLEVLTTYIDGMDYSDRLKLGLRPEQIVLHRPG